MVCSTAIGNMAVKAVLSPCKRHVHGSVRHPTVGIRRLASRHRHQRGHQQRHDSDHASHKYTPVGAAQVSHCIV